jgi:hypothetical protein
VRFDVTQALDAIELSLTTDVAIVQAVVDLGEVAWFSQLDNGREVNLLRAGQLIDAFSQHIGEATVTLYPVVGRPLLSDQDLTSKERMVLGRWADDGLIEVVPAVNDRVLEVADLAGLPVISCDSLARMEGRYPWLRHESGRALRLAPHSGGARLRGGTPGPAQRSGAGTALLSRVWACPRRECPSFGFRRLVTQPVPHLRAGVPVCPRHEEPLVNAGPRPPALAVAVLVGGAVCTRFAVRGGRPVVVGRAPDSPDGVAVGGWLPEEAVAMVSRNHVRLEMHGDQLVVTDLSTNGTLVRTGAGSPLAALEQVQLANGQSYPLGRMDVVEMHDGVALIRADSGLTRSGGAAGSVMGDAPTISMRPPPDH